MVRLLATDADRLLTHAEIALRGGLSVADVRHLSFLTLWDEVPVLKMKKFLIACGVDFADPSRMRYLNRRMKDRLHFRAAQKSDHWKDYSEALGTLL